jgi:hypothetical protein
MARPKKVAPPPTRRIKGMQVDEIMTMLAVKKPPHQNYDPIYRVRTAGGFILRSKHW